MTCREERFRRTGARSGPQARARCALRPLLPALLAFWASGAIAQDGAAAGLPLVPALGALAALMLQSLLLYLAVRDRGLPGLMLLVLGAAVALVPAGAAPLSLPDMPGWAVLMLQAGPALAGLGGALFVRSFLATRRTAPRLDRILQASALLFAAAAAAVAVLPSALAAGIGVALGTVFALLALIGGLRLRPRRIPGLDLYLMGTASMLIGMAAGLARGLGLLPAGGPTGHVVLSGVVLGLVMLSAAQAGRSVARHRRLADERAQTLAASEQQLRTLQQAEQVLTQQLSQRNRELEFAHQRMQDKERGLCAAALHDPLTGLANALLLSDRITQGIARSKRHNCRTAVLFVGLDDFETVLDTAGDAIGGEVLKMAAQRLRGLVRDEDTVARAGSGEFALVLADVFEPQDVERVATEAARELGHVFHVDGHTILLSASVGCAIYPEDGGDSAALLRRAEKLMFPSRDGKGRAGAAAGGERASETAC